MKYKCLGIQSYDFTGKEGTQIQGNKLFVSEVSSYPMKGLIGSTCDILKINNEHLQSLVGNHAREELIGKEIDLQFNQKGYLINASYIK